MTDELARTGPAPVANDDSVLTSYDEVGDSIIAMVESVLCSQCDTEGSSLNSEEIKEILRALRTVPGLMPKLLHGLIAPHQIMRFVRDPFSRALVQPFAHLLQAPDGPALNDGAISRRFLPGFFVAIRLMVGGARYAQYQNVCDMALAEARLEPDTNPNQNAFWDVIYERADVQSVVREVYTRFLLRFDPYDKRKAWFIKLINSKLGAMPSMVTTGPQDPWRFESEHFRALCEAMFAGSDGVLRADIINTADTTLGAAEAHRAQEIYERFQRDS